MGLRLIAFSPLASSSLIPTASAPHPTWSGLNAGEFAVVFCEQVFSQKKESEEKPKPVYLNVTRE